MTQPDVSTATLMPDYNAIKKLYDRLAYNKDADIILTNGHEDGYTCLAYYISKSGQVWYILSREKGTP